MAKKHGTKKNKYGELCILGTYELQCELITIPQEITKTRVLPAINVVRFIAQLATKQVYIYEIACESKEIAEKVYDDVKTSFIR